MKTKYSLLIELPITDSTNKYAERNLQKLPNKSIIFAHYQTNGKGTGSNSWHSQKNKNLLLSVIIKQQIPITKQLALLQTTALAIIDYLQYHKIQGKIKWPNDILVNSKKICGILIENKINSTLISTSIIGIGININQTLFPPEINATSLKLLKNKELDIITELFTLKNFIFKRLQTLNNHNLSTEYQQKLYNYKSIQWFKTQYTKFQAVIEGIDEFGRLKLKVNNKIQTFNFKEIEFIL